MADKIFIIGLTLMLSHLDVAHLGANDRFEGKINTYMAIHTTVVAIIAISCMFYGIVFKYYPT